MSHSTSRAEIDTMVSQMKTALVDVAFPFAVARSTLLQYASSNLYFDSNANFDSALSTFAVSASPMTMSIFLTYSPSAHFDASFSDISAADSSTISLVQLADVHSAQQLTNTVSDFFEDSLSSVLILQCDPLLSSHSLILHSQIICARCFTQSTATNKHLVLLVHLPPGFGKQQRHWYLDFPQPWKTVFIDDLRHAAIGVTALLQQSVHELSVKKLLDISVIICERFQAALALCLSPNDRTGPEIKVDIVRQLTGNPEVLTSICCLVDAVLEQHAEVSHKSGVHLHVEMATSVRTCGSLSQQLERSVHSLVVQALASVLRYLDSNGNLASFAANSDVWCQLLKHPDTVAVEILTQQSLVSTHAADSVGPPINLGKFGHHTGCFPFSTQVMSSCCCLNVEAWY